MCGIFGIIGRSGADITFDETVKILNRLYALSESRGKESAGLHAYLPESFEAWTLKGAIPARAFLRSKEYRHCLDEIEPLAFSNGSSKPTKSFALLAHSRLVTNGTAEKIINNQPVRSNGVTMVHNGIIVNVNELWADYPQLVRTAEVDSEILTALVSSEMSNGLSPTQATASVYAKIKGAASIAWVEESSSFAVLATNTGDLYCYGDLEKGVLVFASELHFLEQALQGWCDDATTIGERLNWMPPGQGCLIDFNSLVVTQFFLDKVDGPGPDVKTRESTRCIQHEIPIGPIAPANVILAQADESLVRYSEDSIRTMKRCTRCVLPETFPFISFDEEGVCSYCHSYKPRYLGLDPEKAKADFISSVQKYRGNGERPDVIVPFSGGRDSCYGLHLIKNEFNLTPTTFTYDWGMVTDLARRNIARMCGALGVQNILVSSDIKTKRENIRKNVSAWLRRPELGLVPLFMAGDKHFFSVVNQIKRQTGIKLDLWSANPLENTDFKSGFCGVSPDFDKTRVDYLSFGRKARLAAYYGIHFLKNPAYINSSILDTAGAFFAYYFEPRRDFFFMFDHLVWNEDEVNRILLNEYDFELSPDSTSSWRIGDGTAPFYNYIYVTARGFSEFDTFRSNQIREGMITREQAMQRVPVENRPRLESLRWYLDVIGLDFNVVIHKVNQLDTMGLHD